MPTFSHSAGGVVLNARGEVLLVHQRDRSWSLPKGAINPGEEPKDAAIREIAEETGIRDLTFVKFLKSYSRYAMANTGGENPEKLKRITMYLFTAAEEDPRPMDPRISEARWVAQKDVAMLLSHPKDRDFFEEVMRELEESPT